MARPARSTEASLACGSLRAAGPCPPLAEASLACGSLRAAGPCPPLAEASLACGSLRAAGFTLVEVITALAIIGIVAGIAAPRFFGTSEFRARFFYDDVRSAVAHAHALAVASGCEVEFSISGSSYRLRQRSACTSGAFSAEVVSPSTGQVPFTGTAPSGVALAASVNPFRFDALGRVRSGAGSVSDVSLTVGGRSFTAVGETGFVYAP
jgi:prepilin-type N-terminal cleavage/methylation domain-containing protein